MRWFIFAVTLLIFSTFFIIDVQAYSWWNTNWKIRRPIEVSTNYNLTDYQVKITFINTTKLYQEGKIDKLCRAIRFTNYNPSTDTETLIPHWNQTPCNITGGNTTFWVKGNFSDRGGVQIYVYYNNTTYAPDVSSFNNTFTKEFNVTATGVRDLTLKAEWHFDENDGDNVYDSSGNGNTGVIVGVGQGVTWSGSDGGFWDTRTDVKFSYGNSLNFTNGSGYIKVPHSESLNISKNLTIEMWAKGNSSGPTIYNYNYNNYLHSPQMQVVGRKIHYVWIGRDSNGFNQIFTGVYNISKNQFSTQQRTFTQYWKAEPRMQVVGNKIYYVWYEKDGNQYIIKTATLNLENNEFTQSPRRSTSNKIRSVRLQVVGNIIHYAWIEECGNDWCIYVANTTLDGSGWSPQSKHSSDNNIYDLDMQAMGNYIYYVWRPPVSESIDAVIARLDTQSGRFNILSNIENGYVSAYREPKMHVFDDKLYFIAWESGEDKIHILEYNIPNGPWSSYEIFDGDVSSGDYMSPDMQVVGNKVYVIFTNATKTYVGITHVGSLQYIHLQEVGSCGYYRCFDPLIQVVGSKIYYSWNIGNTRDTCQNMKIAESDSNIISKEDSYGIGTSYILLQATGENQISPFIDGGLTELLYKKQTPLTTAMELQPILTICFHLTHGNILPSHMMARV